MKVLKILGLVFTKIAFVISMMLLFASLSTSYILEDGVTSLLISGLPNVGQSEVNKEMTYEVDPQFQVPNADIEVIYNQILDDLGITEEQLFVILESDTTKELINEFVETAIEDIVSDEQDDFDLGEKILDFVEDNQSEIEKLIGQPLPMDKIEDFAKSEEVSQFNNQYNEAIGQVRDNIPSSVKNTIRMIEVFISEEFRVICLIVSAILLVIIALLQWSPYIWIRTLANTLLIINGVTFVISLFSNFAGSVISTLLRINASFEFSKLTMSSGLATGLGVILLIIYFMIKKNVKKGDSVDEVSEVAS